MCVFVWMCWCLSVCCGVILNMALFTADIVEFNLPERQTARATEGSPLVLRCDDYISVGRTIVEWSMYDTARGRFIPVQQSDAHIFGELDFGLYFPAFRADQFGRTSQFQCTVSNQDAQTFEDSTFDVTINDGELLTCLRFIHTGQTFHTLDSLVAFSYLHQQSCYHLFSRKMSH